MENLTRRDVLARTALAGASALFASHSAHAQTAAYALKFGNDLPAAHPVNVRLREAIAAIVEETKGAVSIDLFPNNQLGSDTDMISQIRAGALEMATLPGTVMSTLIPAMSISGLGFAFTSYDKVWASMDGALGGFMRQQIAKANLHPFDAVWDNGFRQVTTSTKPIQTPEDLQNFKIRVPLVPLWVSMFKALGAAPVSIPLSEAYSSLQTKIASGQENPLALIDFAKFYEVQKYCSLTNHAWDGFWLVANNRAWAALPETVQAVVSKHFNAAALKERADIQQANITLQASLETKGLVFNKTDPAEFQKALRAAGFYGQWKTKFGPEAWALLQQYAGELG